MVRFSWIIILIVIKSMLGCSTDSTEQTTEDITNNSDSTTSRDSQSTLDVTAPACCPLGVCEIGMLCLSEVCVPELQAGQCYFDGQCQTGQTCEGATLCSCDDLASCEHVVGHCQFPVGCCQQTSDCQTNEVCIQGQCVAEPSADRCYLDSDCQDGSRCKNEHLCSCNDENCQTSLGYCGDGAGCCIQDGECGENQHCVAGFCVNNSTDGRCFDDGDCSNGTTCLGDDVPCACGECSVLPIDGVCGDSSSACCDDTADCAENQRCVDGLGCYPSPIEGQCYNDSDCGFAQRCEGAQVCSCNDSNCDETHVGQCVADVTRCDDDSQCERGFRCVKPDAEVCFSSEMTTTSRGICLASEIDGCWSQADCSTTEKCIAESLCLQGQCQRPNHIGTCHPKPVNNACCNSHADCQSGYECRNYDGSLTCPVGLGAVCVPAAGDGINCWTNFDCFGDQICQRAWMCPCGAACRFGRMGSCVDPEYCIDDNACGDSAICSKDYDCNANPCSVASNCSPNGVCREQQSDQCWSHGECPTSQYCEGLRVCDLQQTCFLPDAPGQCAPRGQLGDCCTSFFGCQGGLKCGSVQASDQCTLDITSVCTPVELPAGQCYLDSDCQSGLHCQGQSLCACGLQSCDESPQPGTCVLD